LVKSIHTILNYINTYYEVSCPIGYSFNCHKDHFHVLLREYHKLLVPSFNKKARIFKTSPNFVIFFIDLQQKISFFSDPAQIILWHTPLSIVTSFIYIVIHLINMFSSYLITVTVPPYISPYHYVQSRIFKHTQSASLKQARPCRTYTNKRPSSFQQGSARHIQRAIKQIFRLWQPISKGR